MQAQLQTANSSHYQHYRPPLELPSQLQGCRQPPSGNSSNNNTGYNNSEQQGQAIKWKCGSPQATTHPPQPRNTRRNPARAGWGQNTPFGDCALLFWGPPKPPHRDPPTPPLMSKLFPKVPCKVLYHLCFQNPHFVMYDQCKACHYFQKFTFKKLCFCTGKILKINKNLKTNNGI